eukprot:SAG31_NODE_1564_length_7868_cov_5.665766_6_plen_114_part_00
MEAVGRLYGTFHSTIATSWFDGSELIKSNKSADQSWASCVWVLRKTEHADRFDTFSVHVVSRFMFYGQVGCSSLCQQALVTDYQRQEWTGMNLQKKLLRFQQSKEHFCQMQMR